VSGEHRPFWHNKIWVFVYGSLLPGLRNHVVIEPYLIASYPGRVQGKLVDFGPYPALLSHPSGLVRGMWMNVTLEAMPALDALEGFVGIEEANDYERIWTTDMDDPSRSGWMYIWTESRGYPFVDGDWWPDVLRDREKG
jgi:gamma-glutamylcyclotransferase (GGCT)/AIG2-like uncharacterized protein YtfP